MQKILRNSKNWRFWEEAPWEKRIPVVIGFIHNIQVLQILQIFLVIYKLTYSYKNEK